ncbi:MAG: hypothetical protein RL375_1071, partial [Pseudomonadota bacterium]
SSHRVGQAIGNSSYPIYVLHFPLIVLAVELQRSLPDGLSRRLVGPATVVLILTLAWGAWRAYDTPVRRVLSRRWVG